MPARTQRPRLLGICCISRVVRASLPRRWQACRREAGCAVSGGSLGVFSLGGIAATFVLWAVVSLQSPSLPPNPQPRSTIAVRPDRQALADGSTVELNANAKIDVQFTPDRRTVHLLGGEALFTVAKDSTQRPFVVVAPGVEVKADGTVFSVRGRLNRSQGACDRGAGDSDRSRPSDVPSDGVESRRCG